MLHPGKVPGPGPGNVCMTLVMSLVTSVLAGECSQPCSVLGSSVLVPGVGVMERHWPGVWPCHPKRCCAQAAPAVPLPACSGNEAPLCLVQLQNPPRRVRRPPEHQGWGSIAIS